MSHLEDAVPRPRRPPFSHVCDPLTVYDPAPADAAGADPDPTHKRGTAMKCPKCDALLNEVTRAGVLVDVCPRCLGMWLERGELEKIAARLHAVERDDDDDQFRASRNANDRHDDDPRRSGRRKRWSDLFEIFD